jgi:stage II sporulation protein E
VLTSIIASVLTALLVIVSTGTGSFPVNLLFLVLDFAILLVACRWGTGAAAVVGTLGGIIQTVWTGNLAYMGILCAGGVLAGVFTSLGRVGSSIAFLAGMMGLAAAFDWELLSTLVGPVVAAIIVFLALPMQLIRGTRTSTPAFKPKEGELIQSQWKNLSESFQVIANYFDDKKLIAGLQQSVLECAACMDAEDWRYRFLESQQAIRTQFSEMGRIIEETAGQQSSMKNVTGNLETIIKRNLKQRQIQVKRAVFFEYDNQHREAYLTLCTGNHGYITTKEIAEYLSHETGRKWVPSRDSRTVIGKNLNEVKFEEETAYQLLYGVARVTKDGEEVSGDTFSVKYLPSGKVLLCLSDGMGSGQVACLESKMAVELLEQLTQTGFAVDACVRLINNVLIMNLQEQHPTTMDICMVDLYAGNCEFVKMGAPHSYLKRGKKVTQTGQMQLPLGMLDMQGYRTQVQKLEDGDFIVLMTDGVLDAIAARGVEDPQEWIADVIARYRKMNPKEMAGWLMGHVLAEGQCARDDMTILVASIWKK